MRGDDESPLVVLEGLQRFSLSAQRDAFRVADLVLSLRVSAGNDDASCAFGERVVSWEYGCNSNNHWRDLRENKHAQDQIVSDAAPS